MVDILLPIFPIHLLENIHFSHHPHVPTRKFSLIFSCNYNLKMMRENFFSLEGKTYLNLTSSCDVFSLIFSTNCFSENVNTTIFIYFRLIPWRRDPKDQSFSNILHIFQCKYVLYTLQILLKPTRKSFQFSSRTS